MTEKIMVFIPMYNCERQIPRVLAQFTPEIQRRFSEILIVDNNSCDGSREAAQRSVRSFQNCTTTLLRNNQNYGLGGSHKVALNYARDKGYDYCIVLHGDDQGDLNDILPHLDARLHHRYDCLLSARFMPGSRLKGYSWFRTAGNLMFNILFSMATGRVQWDLGSGLCCFSRSFLQKNIYMKCSDDLTFNYTLQLHCAAAGIRQKFFPVTWREYDQISNVRLMRQSWQMIKMLGSYLFKKDAFLNANQSDPDFNYTATPVIVT